MNTTQTKQRKPVNPFTAPKDAVKLLYSERLRMWLRPENNPVSMAYYSYLFDEDIVLYQQYLFGGVWVKFIGLNDEIN